MPLQGQAKWSKQTFYLGLVLFFSQGLLFCAEEKAYISVTYFMMKVIICKKESSVAMASALCSGKG